ncbi:MAG TPA: hypothetical protein VG078_10805 [Acidimicrobiales bacterium]|nr:hypothetical protein [Acidimicrobiales bacterium]
MGTNSGIYKFVFVLHLLAVIIGFGSVFLAGVFGTKAKARGGREGVAVGEVTYEVGKQWSEWFIYAVPIFGILLVLFSDDEIKFSEPWISWSFLLYLVGIGVTHAVHLPNIRRMNQLAGELASGAPPGGGSGGPPPQVAELEARGKRAAAVGAVLNLIVVVVVFLMVWQPGRF